MAWLYVPGVGGSKWDSKEPLEMPTAPSVTSNGKPMPRASWQRVWKTGGWIRRLSGTTLPASTAAHGVARWISSLPDSPASRSAQPASDKGTETPATSGRTSAGLSTGRGRLSSFWRTSLPLFQLDNGTDDPRTWWSETSWSDWATALRKRSSVHRTLGHHTSENGCSSWGQAKEWPTPAARDYRSPNSQDSQARRGRDVETGQQLPNYVAHQWTTPMAQDSEQAGSEAYGRTLAKLSRQWPTPDAGVFNDGESVAGWDARREKVKQAVGSGSGMGERLTIEAKRFHLVREIDTPGQPSSPNAQSSPRLNPLFVEALMGWPEGWSSARLGCGCLATASCPHRPPRHSGI